MSGQRCCNVRSGQVDKTNNCIWATELIRDALYPARFVYFLMGNPVHLDIDGLAHPRVSDIRQIFPNRVIAPDRVVWAEDPWDWFAHEPGQIFHLPDVMMGINDLHTVTSSAA